MSPAQILYTLNHAKADLVAVNAEFIPILTIIRDRLATVKRLIPLTDDGASLSGFKAPYAGEDEALLAAAPARTSVDKPNKKALCEQLS